MQPQRGAGSSDGRRLLWAAILLGLIVRIAVFSQTSSLGATIVDEQHYTQLAANLLQGEGFGWGPGQLTSIRPPLYPAMVASIWAVAGAGNLQAVRLVQILLALATTVLVYQLGRRTFGPRVGNYAAAVFWLYPSLIFFNFTILTETLFTLLLVAFVLCAVRLVQAPGASTALACGVSLGLAALARSVMWPLPLLLCPLLVLLLGGSFARRVALAALVLAGFAVTVGPWAVRNTRLQGVVTIVDTMGGVNMRLGNYEHTPEDRMWAAIDLNTDEKEWSYELAQQHPGQKFTEGQKDKWAQSAAIDYVRANPGLSMRRALIKFADFWGIEREFIALVQHGPVSPPPWFTVLAGVAIVLGYVGVVIAGGAGIWLAAPPWRAHVLLLLPIVLITAVHTLVFGHSRYHMPLMPILGLYAAALVEHGRGRIWPPRGLMWIGAALTVALLVAIWLRQFVFADADRIRALFGGGG
jgi:4-amino-4-deoxy-L-arabinose transferase-like glycosyltransferase